MGGMAGLETVLQRWIWGRGRGDEEGLLPFAAGDKVLVFSADSVSVTEDQDALYGQSPKQQVLTTVFASCCGDGPGESRCRVEVIGCSHRELSCPTSVASCPPQRTEQGGASATVAEVPSAWDPTQTRIPVSHRASSGLRSAPSNKHNNNDNNQTRLARLALSANTRDPASAPA